MRLSHLLKRGGHVGSWDCQGVLLCMFVGVEAEGKQGSGFELVSGCFGGRGRFK